MTEEKDEFELDENIKKELLNLGYERLSEMTLWELKTHLHLTHPQFREAFNLNFNQVKIRRDLKLVDEPHQYVLSLVEDDFLKEVLIYDSLVEIVGNIIKTENKKPLTLDSVKFKYLIKKSTDITSAARIREDFYNSIRLFSTKELSQMTFSELRQTLNLNRYQFKEEFEIWQIGERRQRRYSITSDLDENYDLYTFNFVSKINLIPRRTSLALKILGIETIADLTFEQLKKYLKLNVKEFAKEIGLSSSYNPTKYNLRKNMKLSEEKDQNTLKRIGRMIERTNELNDEQIEFIRKIIATRARNSSIKELIPTTTTNKL